ncbi:hypothetical protein K457DRAFT_24945 [Linnemannia elongata AG-77]|uniref:Uncharacterized protein n=1 Tax=Linnemannia elongata AG-77 TaxID=1314771 RepID=A0A197JEY5_9FUNG|nr:hypothetical protein K457DRAFT_24945 [Linnemannia elongata AG-77]
MVSIGADDVYLSTVSDPKILRVSSSKKQAAPYRRTLASALATIFLTTFSGKTRKTTIPSACNRGRALPLDETSRRRTQEQGLSSLDKVVAAASVHRIGHQDVAKRIQWQAEAAHVVLHFSVTLVPLNQEDFALFGGVKHLESKSSLATDVLTPSIPHPTILLSNDNILSPTSTKHPRDTFNDAFDNEAIGLVNTSRNRSISPTIAPTEPLDSLPEVYNARQEKHSFQACQYEDEDEEDGEGECDSAGAGDANDVHLPDTTDQVPGSLLFLMESTWRPDFRVSLPTLRRKRSISMTSTKLCNARSGVILLNWEGTESQKVHFGEKTLAQMREKALEKWQETNAMAARNQARIWLDPHKGHRCDCTKSLKHISGSGPLECNVDSTTELGRSSHFQKSRKTKNANDLVQVEIPLKDAQDFIGDAYCVHNAVLVEWQEIGQIIALYLTFKCGNVYFIVHVRDVTIRDDLTELGTIGTQIRT